MPLERHLLRFNGARIRLIEDRPLRHLSSGMYIPANTRGLMAAGVAAEFRLLAGPEVEQELRGHVPIPIGSAVPTGAGNLQDKGVQRAVHAVATREPGVRPRASDLERAFISALSMLEAEGVRDITLPLATARLERSTGENARVMARLVAAHLRRRSRLTSVVVAGLDSMFLDEFADEMEVLGASRDD